MSTFRRIGEIHAVHSYSILLINKFHSNQEVKNLGKLRKFLNLLIKKKKIFFFFYLNIYSYQSMIGKDTNKHNNLDPIDWDIYRKDILEYFF